MSKFLNCWLTEASRVLGGDLGTPVEFTAATTGRPAEAVLQVVTAIGGAWTGQFTVTIAESALAALLIQAGDIAAEQGIDRETWRKLFGQVAQAAAQLLSKTEDTPCEVVSVVLGSKETDAGSLHALRCGQVTATVVLVDEVSAALPVTLPAAHKPAASTSTSTSAGSEKAAMSSAAGALPPSSRAARNASEAETDKGIELLLDIELEASLRFGSREMPLNEILELGPGDVIQLNRHVSDPVDLIVGDKIVARGDVVLVNGNFGLRVTEVAEPRKCLESIRCLF